MGHIQERRGKSSTLWCETLGPYVLFILLFDVLVLLTVEAEVTNSTNHQHHGLIVNHRLNETATTNAPTLVPAVINSKDNEELLELKLFSEDGKNKTNEQKSSQESQAGRNSSGTHEVVESKSHEDGIEPISRIGLAASGKANMLGRGELIDDKASGLPEVSQEVPTTKAPLDETGDYDDLRRNYLQTSLLESFNLYTTPVPDQNEAARMPPNVVSAARIPLPEPTKIPSQPMPLVDATDRPSNKIQSFGVDSPAKTKLLMDQFDQDNLISRAGIADLLQIIKHLNLVRNKEKDPLIPPPSHNSFINTFKNMNERSMSNLFQDSSPPNNNYNQNSVANSQAIPAQYPYFRDLLENRSQILRNLIKQQTGLMSSKAMNVLLNHNADGMSTQESSLNRNKVSLPSDTNDLASSGNNDDDNKSAKVTKSSAKPHKVPLVSPYTANFESEIQSLGPILANRVSNEKRNQDDQSKEPQPSKKKPTKDHDLKDSSSAPRKRPDSIIYYTTDTSNGETIKTLSPLPTITEKNLIKLLEQNKMKNMANSSVRTTKTKDQSSSQAEPVLESASTKRGERDTPIATNRPSEAKRYPVKSNIRNSSSNQINPSTANSIPVTSLDSDDSNSLGSNHFDSSKESQPEIATAGLSHLDDPHKKALYYTREPASLLIDDPLISYQRPLTIGELARHHGVPFRLQSQVDELSNHFGNSILKNNLPESFGLASESGNHEDYAAYSSSARLPIDSNSPNFVNSVSPTQLGHTSLENDLKQQLVMEMIGRWQEANGNQNTQATPGLYQHGTRGSQIDVHSTPNGLDLNTIRSLYANQFRSTSSNPLPTPITISSFNNQPVFAASSPPLASTQQLGNQVFAASDFNQQFGVDNKNGSVNLLVTDLANKWALSRMPDLVPIPLAATVPGYLIRLPNGKILAAALTNMFSIQGIQKGPLAANYKRLLNQRIKGLLNKNVYTPTDVQTNSKQVHASLASDSGIHPVVLPAPIHLNPQLINQLVNTHNTHRDKGIASSLFGRGILGQLGFGRYAASALRGNQTFLSRDREVSQSKSTHKSSKPKIVKLTNSPFPSPTLTDQELASLPVADLNEPVFSFADESQLIDTELRPNIPADSKRDHLLLSPQLLALQSQASNHDGLLGSMPPGDLTPGLSNIASSRLKLQQLFGIRGGDSLIQDLFGQSTGKRKSTSSLKSKILSRIEPLFHWLARKTRRWSENSRTGACDKRLHV